MNDQPGDVQRQEAAFLQVLAHRTMLKAYILAIVRDPFLAEDALSDVTLAIAHSWARYDPRQPFASWARGVARRVALANLRKGQRHPVPLADEVLESMAVELDCFGGEAEQEPARHALRECVQKLSETNQALVRRRYFAEESYPDMAQATGRSVDALYVAFGRIHHALARCVEKQLNCWWTTGSSRAGPAAGAARSRWRPAVATRSSWSISKPAVRPTSPSIGGATASRTKSCRPASFTRPPRSNPLPQHRSDDH
jgi:RNA polymerase sigma-70 factor, ECF subfamily